MESFFTSRELLAAVIGGILTAAGSYLSIWAQMRWQDREKCRVARSFFRQEAMSLKFIVENVSNHFVKNNEVWFEYTALISNVNNTINRNIELLVFIDNDNEILKIREFFSNIYFLSQRSVVLQNRIYDVRRPSNEFYIADESERSLKEREIFIAIKEIILEMDKRVSVRPL